MGRVPISLIIDDSSPINTYYFHDLGRWHEMIVPVGLAERFAAACRKNGVRGKFSCLPMPCCMGRIDQELSHVPQEHLLRYLKCVREEITPMFSITSEVLTHYMAYNMEKKKYMHIMEDVYFSNISAEEIADYVGLSLEILCNVGITPDGVTSPWSTGWDNEDNYARGIGMAFKRTMHRDRCFYFLHCSDEIEVPTVMCDSEETGRVVTIPATFSDPFWDSQQPITAENAIANVQKNVDAMLSPDGKSGSIIDRLNTGKPIVLLTHWQSLFSDGRYFGISGFEVLAERINKYLANDVQWMNFKEISETV